MQQMTVDTLEVGDKITQDGLKVCTVVETGVRYLSNDDYVLLESEQAVTGKTQQSKKSPAEIKHYFTRWD
jgi:hypothetical protein